MSTPQNPPPATPADALLGRVAVAAKLITMEQLAQATREQARIGGGKNLGEVLIAMGFLSKDNLAKAVELQKSVIARAREKKGDAPVTPAIAKPAPELGSETDSPAAASLAREARPTPKAAPATAPKARPVVGSAASAASRIPLDKGLDALLVDAAGQGASDVHLHSGSNVRLRVRGSLVEVPDSKLSPPIAEKLILSVLSDEDRAALETHGELDFCHTVKGLARFRANVYKQLRGLDASFRRISLQPPTLDDLNLPSALAKFTNFHQGMVLITGPSACGKSSTMAALVNLINEERAEHILTIEDPIEYLHPSKRCVVNQRNVKRHTESFARALRAALREDPDVIVIGELRDRETISLAMTAAETGHFVLATLHTDNAVRTVNRIIGSFPPEQQDQVRAMLSESLRAVISQRLLPRADARGMVPAVEILVVNRPVGNLIREEKTVQIRSTMQTGAASGMCLLDASLAQLVKAGSVKRDEALLHAEDPKLIPGGK
ncbi:MAG TPA: type IV pilus twitching motility protein PilT [Myxococcota bacterium]|nr:type IV pilus twitching motility protein PilT [Myxococcota bacterium]